jgi:hypothetical protein
MSSWNKITSVEKARARIRDADAILRRLGGDEVEPSPERNYVETLDQMNLAVEYARGYLDDHEGWDVETSVLFGLIRRKFRQATGIRWTPSAVSRLEWKEVAVLGDNSKTRS